ncbi:hypothetical protein J3R82DRAFT_3115 [Butyriboletus roseoflavus]|nr:hypothetical protein J3R82DRAFT_3115 [Butyriboletus roseoflavus]
MVAPGSNQPASSGLDLLDSSTIQSSLPQPSPADVEIPRTTTIEFAPTFQASTVMAREIPLSTEHSRRQRSRDSLYSRRYPSIGGQSQVSLTRNHVLQPIVDATGPGQAQASQTDFGGFPMPHKLLGMLFRRLFPKAANRLRRTVTIPTTTALSGGELGRTASISGAVGNIPEGSKPVAYISFDAIVGRNSAFQMLTSEQLEELGGVEYRGLNALLWLVALVSISIAENTNRMTIPATL